MAGESLYDVLHSKYGIGAMHSEREIGVATCNELEARLLNLSVGATCLSLLVGVYDEKGRPIEFTRSLNHPKFVVFKTAPADASKPAE